MSLIGTATQQSQKLWLLAETICIDDNEREWLYNTLIEIADTTRTYCKSEKKFREYIQILFGGIGKIIEGKIKL